MINTRWQSKRTGDEYLEPPAKQSRNSEQAKQCRKLMGMNSSQSSPSDLGAFDPMCVDVSVCDAATASPPLTNSTLQIFTTSTAQLAIHFFWISISISILSDIYIYLYDNSVSKTTSNTQDSPSCLIVHCFPGSEAPSTGFLFTLLGSPQFTQPLRIGGRALNL